MYKKMGGRCRLWKSLSLPLLWTATILALFPRDTPLQRVNTFESLEHLCTWNSCRRNQVKNFKTLKTVRAERCLIGKDCRLLFWFDRRSRDSCQYKFQPSHQWPLAVISIRIGLPLTSLIHHRPVVGFGDCRIEYAEITKFKDRDLCSRLVNMVSQCVSPFNLYSAASW